MKRIVLTAVLGGLGIGWFMSPLLPLSPLDQICPRRGQYIDRKFVRELRVRLGQYWCYFSTY